MSGEISECTIGVGWVFLVLHDTLALLCEYCISSTVPHSEAAPALTIWAQVATNTISRPTFCCGLRALHIHPMAAASSRYGMCSDVSFLA